MAFSTWLLIHIFLTAVVAQWTSTIHNTITGYKTTVTEPPSTVTHFPTTVNQIIRPTPGEVVLIGQPYTIKWTSLAGSKVDITIRGESAYAYGDGTTCGGYIYNWLCGPLAVDKANDGELVWTWDVDAGGGPFQIDITVPRDSGVDEREILFSESGNFSIGTGPAFDPSDDSSSTITINAGPSPTHSTSTSGTSSSVVLQTSSTTSSVSATSTHSSSVTSSSVSSAAKPTSSAVGNIGSPKRNGNAGMGLVIVVVTFVLIR